MRVTVGFGLGVLTALAIFFAAVGGVFVRLLSGEDDFDPDDDPIDVFPFTPDPHTP